MSDQEAVITSPEAYRRALLRCYDTLYTVASLPLAELSELQQKAETLGPFLDPTAWQHNHRKMQEDQMVVQALRAALSAIPAEHREAILILGRIKAARDVAQETTDARHRETPVEG